MKAPYVGVRMVAYFLRNPKSADFMTTSMLYFDLKPPSSWHVLTGSLRQGSVLQLTKCVKFDIVSRCFENKNNDCCQTKFFKNAIFYLRIHIWLLCCLDVLAAVWPDDGFENL